MAKSKTPARRERAEAPEFIEVWQTSSTRREVESRLGMTKAAVRTRACRYRQRGVPLKDLPPDGMMGWSWKWDVLAEDARKILAEHEASKAGGDESEEDQFPDGESSGNASEGGDESSDGESSTGAPETGAAPSDGASSKGESQSPVVADERAAPNEAAVPQG